MIGNVSFCVHYRILPLVPCRACLLLSSRCYRAAVYTDAPTRSLPLIKEDCLSDSYRAVLVPCFTSLYKRKLASISVEVKVILVELI